MDIAVDKIRRFKDIYKGERCFVIGTGPSLNKANLGLVKGEILFGVNTLFKGFERLGIRCKYYAVSDSIEWRQSRSVLLSNNMIVFTPHRPGGETVVILPVSKHEHVNNGYFSKDLTQKIHPGGTVTVSICLQVCYYMGFDKVYLLGCDCDFSSQHDHFGGPRVLSDGEVNEVLSIDPKNVWFNSDWSKIFASYAVCEKEFEEAGREIINCTAGGNLEVFKRMTLEEVVGSSNLNSG